MMTGNGTIQGLLVNSGGTVSPALGTGVLSTSPASNYQQGALGSLLVVLGGSAAGNQAHSFAVGGQAQLDGQLQLQFTNDLVPVPGDSFTVLTCASQSGKFAAIATAPVSNSIWIARYNPTNVTLTLTHALELPRPVASNGSLTFPVSTTAGIQYIVHASDSLAPPSWQTIDSFSGDGTVQTVSDPIVPRVRFYRVILQ